MVAAASSATPSDEQTITDLFRAGDMELEHVSLFPELNYIVLYCIMRTRFVLYFFTW